MSQQTEITPEDNDTSTVCDICGDTVYDKDHAVHFRATSADSQTVCESCVEELWSEVLSSDLD